MYNRKNKNKSGDFLNVMLQQANRPGVQYLVGLVRTKHLVNSTLGDIAAEGMFRVMQIFGSLSRVILCFCLIFGFLFKKGTVLSAQPLTGPDAMRFENLPLLDNAKTFQWSSWSRPEVHDAYSSDPDGYKVILDIKGPGSITHFWSTGMRNPPPPSRQLKFYFDEAVSPQLSTQISKWCDGTSAPFLFPLACFFNIEGRPGSNISFYQLPFKKRCRVTISESDEFYHFITQTYPTADGIETWTGREDYAPIRRMWEDAGTDPKSTAKNKTVSGTVAIAHGASAVIYNRTGKESIASIKINPGTSDISVLSKTWIRCYWDGSDDPQVNAPLDYFFGTADRIVSYKSLATGADPYYNYFPMPYWKSAKIEIVNESSTDYSTFDYVIEYKTASVIDYPEKSSGYFCARYNSATVSQFELNYVALEAEGQGRVVGLVRGGKATNESDEEVYIDGNLTPQYWGSGGEDLPLFNWGFWTEQRQLWGSTGEANYYRYFIPDAIAFHNQIRFTLEHHEYWPEAWKSNSFDVGSYPLGTLCFYYWRPEKGMYLTDTIDIGNGSSEFAHGYTVNGQTWSGKSRYSYEGERYLDMIVDNGRKFKGYSEFTVKIDPSNTGVQVRRRAEQVGIQEAKVYVDGSEVIESQFYSPIHRPKTNIFYKTGQVWRDFEFEIPQSYTHGKSQIKIKIENSGSDQPNHSDWSEYYYWVYSRLGNYK